MTRQSSAPAGRATPFAVGLAALLLVGLVWRLLYVLAQSEWDPFLEHPLLDGAYYLKWARAIVAGEQFEEGAFYLAPLYPFLVAGWMRVAGDAPSALFAAQQFLSLATAALIAVGARQRLGAGAALAAAALFMLYPPLAFYASTPLGETVALLLLAAALALAWRVGPRAGFLAGLVAGVAATGRPNLLLVPLAWAAVDLARRAPRRAALIVAGAALALVPTAVHNYAASGHLVPVSANGGMTLYHGNGPGARGVFEHPAGFSMRFEHQRDEATAIARRRSGEDFDAVEADGWWARRALSARLAAPLQSVTLFGRRALLTLGSSEIGLDYAPRLDRNPWRPMLRVGGLEFAPISFAVLLALATAGLVLRGARGSGGAELWAAWFACLATPLLFYMSSRYRLPAAALLAVPAGAGLAALIESAREAATRARLLRGLAAALVAGLFSATLTLGGIARRLDAEALSNRAAVLLRSGRAAEALDDANRAVALAPDSPGAHYNLGVALDAAGERQRSAAAYATALVLRPEFGEAAANLSAIRFAEGRYDEAAAVLRDALSADEGCAPCWGNLVASLLAAGRPVEALAAVEAAAAAARPVDPELAALARNAAGAAP